MTAAERAELAGFERDRGPRGDDGQADCGGVTHGQAAHDSVPPREAD